MYTLEEIDSKSKAHGLKAFFIWFLLWMFIIVMMISFALQKNSDLTLNEIIKGFGIFILMVFLSSFIFYAIGVNGMKKKLTEQNAEEERLKKEEHYQRMEELLEKMNKQKDGD